MRLATFFLACIYNKDVNIQKLTDSFFMNPAEFDTADAEAPGWLSRMTQYMKLHYLEKAPESETYKKISKISGILYKQIKYYQGLKKNLHSDSEQVRLILADPNGRMVASTQTTGALNLASTSDEKLKQGTADLSKAFFSVNNFQSVQDRLTELYTITTVLLFNMNKQYDITKTSFDNVDLKLQTEIRKTLFKTSVEVPPPN